MPDSQVCPYEMLKIECWNSGKDTTADSDVTCTCRQVTLCHLATKEHPADVLRERFGDWQIHGQGRG